jgi:hypothetical protein
MQASANPPLRLPGYQMIAGVLNTQPAKTGVLDT